MKLVNFFLEQNRNPFDTSSKELKSIVTGVVAEKDPSKHEAPRNVGTKVGPSSTTLAQHWSNIVSVSRVCWDVNPDEARTVGDAILMDMEGKCVGNYTFKKKAQVRNFASIHYVTIEGEKIQIDPKLLFQRLVMVGMASDDFNTLFDYELCSYPPSLFDNNILMRLGKKYDMIH